jgi:hypothetical protein
LDDVEKVTLRRVQDGLLHMRRALAPFVGARMRMAFGEDWMVRASRAVGSGSRDALDIYGLLKTMLDQWRPAFEGAFRAEDKHRARSYVSVALDARNCVAHSAAPLGDAQALRYLDAFCELAVLVRAAGDDVAALKRLYAEQRRIGLVEEPRVPVPPARQAPAVIKAAADGRAKDGTIEARLLAFVQKNPDLDDDELSRLLGITPRQSINMAARRLETRGLIRRAVGRSGKIVNRAT